MTQETRTLDHVEAPIQSSIPSNSQEVDQNPNYLQAHLSQWQFLLAETKSEILLCNNAEEVCRT